MTAPPVLEVRGLVKTYPGVRALGGVDLDVRAGEVHCIVGPNGAGKSTLIKCIAGSSRRRRARSASTASCSWAVPSAAIDRGVATIYQELDLVGDLTVADNIFLGHEPRRLGFLDRRRMRRETTELLHRVNHAGISPRTHVRDLRPAGQQIVSIARSLSHDVRLLIMDEPSAILDDSEIDTLFGVVRRLAVRRRRRRLHLPPSRRDQADRRPCHRPERRGDRRLRASRHHERRRPGDADGRAEARAAVPRTPDRQRRRRPRGARGAPSARREGGDVRAAPRRGARHRRAGGVGSQRAPAGRVRGRSPGRGRGPRRRRAPAVRPPRQGHRRGARAGAGGPQVPGPPPGVEPHQERDADRRRPLPAGADQRARASARPRRRSCARSTPRPSDGERLARDLSGGNQQKVVLARWLLHQCRVLLLDEPTRGVDVATKAELFRIIADLAGHGLGVVVVSSELEELLRPVLADPRHARRRAGGRARRCATPTSSTSCGPRCQGRSRW